MFEEKNIPESTKYETFTQEEYMVMKDDLLRPIEKIGKAGKIWIAFLTAVFLAGVFAYYFQESRGKYVTTGLRDYTMWGIYISNFLFLVALSLTSVFMSAILKLTNFEWYRPLSRIADVISLSSITMAGICIMISMGRPDRLHYLFIHGRIQSPIVWDIIVVATYFVACVLMLFVALIPSLSTCKNHLHHLPKWQLRMYDLLSFGWEGTADQWKILKKTVLILTVLVIPLGIALRTVSAWLFSTTLRPEWDSTNFGAYFVSGSALLTVAVMIIAVYAFRKTYKLEKYLTEMHFDKLGQAMVLMGLIYAYFNINEYLVPAYKMSSLHANHLLNLFVGEDALFYWSVVFFGIVVPSIFPMFKKMRKPLSLTVIAFAVLIAGWFKFYLIVIPGLSHPLLPIQDVPASWEHYAPSLVEMTIVAATIAGTMLIVTVFSRYFPIISVWEVAEGKLEGKEEIINYK
jgi:molybdopterin-containing oxidoreductase family membrane subunit